MVLCSRWRRSNILTEPSAPTDANMSRPPPARLKAMSYTCPESTAQLGDGQGQGRNSSAWGQGRDRQGQPLHSSGTGTGQLSLGTGRDSPCTAQHSWAAQAGTAPALAQPLQHLLLPVTAHSTCQKEQLHACVIVVSLTEAKTYPFPRPGIFYISCWKVKC